MCFLAFSHQYYYNFSFQSHRLLFSHASAVVRGKNTTERKVASTGDWTHNLQVTSPTCSPLSHPGGAASLKSYISFMSAFTLFLGVYWFYHCQVRILWCVAHHKCQPNGTSSKFTSVDKTQKFSEWERERESERGGGGEGVCQEPFAGTKLMKTDKTHGFNSLPKNNLRLVQNESICRRQIKCKWNTEIWFEKGRKHYGKRRKCWLPEFSPYSICFQKPSFSGSLTLYSIDTHFNTSTADSFWKYCGKRRNCS